MITADGDRVLCDCCGAPAATFIDRKNGRCWAHQSRNPCAIEGCKRTREAPAREGGGAYLATDQWICPDHWRRYVPPRSRMRRAYHAHFRRAKRQGWTAKNDRAFWRFWDQLVRVARLRSAKGHIDKAAIDRLMGWN